MAKSYKLQVRGMGGEIETVRIYHAEYPAATAASDRLPPHGSNPAFVDRLWADYAKLNIYNDRQIDLLELGVFDKRSVWYTISVQFINSDGDKSGMVALDESFMLASAPADPAHLELIVEDITEG